MMEFLSDSIPRERDLVSESDLHDIVLRWEGAEEQHHYRGANHILYIAPFRVEGIAPGGSSGGVKKGTRWGGPKV